MSLLSRMLSVSVLTPMAPWPKRVGILILLERYASLMHATSRLVTALTTVV